MKLFLTLFICFSVSFALSAQKKWKYKIKIVEHSGKKHRGFFYSAEDTHLTLVKNNGDTAKLSAQNISKLYIHRRGIVAPVTILATAAVAVLAINNPDALETALILFVGVPLGVSVGLVTGELFANKKIYKQLHAKDFPLIKGDLQRFTEIK